MTSRNRAWSLLGPLVAVALVVAACQPTTTSGGASPAATPGEQKDLNATINLWMSSEPLRIDPQAGSFVNEIAVNSMVFEPLLSLDSKTSAPVAAAASALPTVSSDGTKYTFKLRDGLKYSDGQPLTMKNYEYAIKRGCDPRLESEYSFVLFDIVGCKEMNEADAKKTTASDYDTMKGKIGVKATDEKTLEITLKSAAGYFTAIMTLWPTYPVREDLVTKGGDKWTDPPTFIGNGPFVMKEWKHNSKIVLERNDSYRKKIQFKTLTYNIINEASVALAAYRQGDLDMTTVAAADLRAVLADATLAKELADRDGSCTYYFGMNVRRPPFDDQNIRTAFARSFDRDDFIKNIRQGIGKAATGFVMPGVPGYDETDLIQKYDVAAAKAALDKASAASKAGLTGLKYTYSDNATNKAIAEWAQNQWKTNLGVTVTLDPVASTAYTGLFRQGKESPQLFFLGWCWDFPDPQNQLTTVWAHKNFSAGRTGYDTLNAKFNELVDKADKESDQAKRLDLYKQAGKILSTDAPAAWVQYNAAKELVKPWIKGITANAGDHGISGFFSLEQIYVLKH